MRKYIALGLMLLAVLTGCQDEFTNSGFNSPGITATIASEDDAATRAVMIDAPTQALNLRWTAGDAIGVFDAENNNTRFEASASDISSDSTQAVFRASASVPQADYLAYYPYDAQATGDMTSLRLTLPARQQYIARCLKAVPDPQACIMVGRGYANSVSFRNVCSILKINYVPRDSDVVERIVFRDLSGQPVSGGFTVAVASDGTPTASFPASGDGQTLTLDCGAGVGVTPTSISTFFLVVPAREYAKGFQLDFKLASGTTDVRTVGRRAGKTLLRSMVYCVGDVSVISEDDYAVVFGEEGGAVLDADLMAMVKTVKYIGDFSGEDGYGSYYELMVKRGTGLKEGMSIVINQLSEALPYGLIGKIVGINDMGDTQQIRVLRYSHGEEAFKYLRIGEANVFNEDGSLNEDALVPLDLANHYSHFVPGEDMEGLSLEITDDGILITDNQWKPYAAMTRAFQQGGFDFPRFSLNLVSTDQDKVSFGGSPSISAAIGASVTDGSVDHISFSLTPSVKLDVAVEKTIELANFVDEEKVIGVMFFTPIAVGPIVLVPELKLSGFVSVKGLLKLSANWSYTLGFNVAASYQNIGGSGGWVFRCSDRSQNVPSIGSLLLPELGASISLSSQFGLALDVGLSFYGIIDFTLFNKMGIDCSATMVFNNGYLSLTPICEAGAAVALIGTNPKRKALAQIEFTPIWMRQLFPYSQLYLDHEASPALLRNGLYYVPSDSIERVPVRAKLRGMVLQDVELSWYITKYRLDDPLKTEEFVSRTPKDGMYPASSLGYSTNNVEEMELTTSFPKGMFMEEGYAFRIYVYNKAPNAVYGQVSMSSGTEYGYVQVSYLKDVYKYSPEEKDNYFIFRDCAGGAEVNADGEIIWGGGR